MYATIFCAENIQGSGNELIVQGLNNTFGVPFIPTLFSFDLTAVISDMDRSNEHNLKIVLVDSKQNTSILADLKIPTEKIANQLVSTTLSTSLKNVHILNEGEHDIQVKIDEVVIGNTKLFILISNGK